MLQPIAFNNVVNLNESNPNNIKKIKVSVWNIIIDKILNPFIVKILYGKKKLNSLFK